MHACLGACIGLQWSINEVFIVTFPLVMGSRAGGVASKLRNSIRLKTMKCGTVLDSVKMLACIVGGHVKIGLQLGIGLQWSIN